MIPIRWTLLLPLLLLNHWGNAQTTKPAIPPASFLTSFPSQQRRSLRWPFVAHALQKQQSRSYPIESLKNVPAGEYYVQVLLDKYQTYHRADGKVVKLGWDRGEGRQWNQAPGNLYSKPIKIKYDPKASKPITLTLDQEIPPIPEPADTKYIKHIKFQSQRLSKFWGSRHAPQRTRMFPEVLRNILLLRYPLGYLSRALPERFSGSARTPPEHDSDRTAPVFSWLVTTASCSKKPTIFTNLWTDLISHGFWMPLLKYNMPTHFTTIPTPSTRKTWGLMAMPSPMNGFPSSNRIFVGFAIAGRGSCMVVQHGRLGGTGGASTVSQ